MIGSIVGRREFDLLCEKLRDLLERERWRVVSSFDHSCRLVYGIQLRPFDAERNESLPNNMRIMRNEFIQRFERFL